MLPMVIGQTGSGKYFYIRIIYILFFGFIAFFPTSSNADEEYPKVWPPLSWMWGDPSYPQNGFVSGSTIAETCEKLKVHLKYNMEFVILPPDQDYNWSCKYLWNHPDYPGYYERQTLLQRCEAATPLIKDKQPGDQRPIFIDSNRMQCSCSDPGRVFYPKRGWCNLPKSVYIASLSGASSTKTLPAGPALPQVLTITDNGKPAPFSNFSVSIEGLGGIFGGTTDENGQFRFNYVPPLFATVSTITATCSECENIASKQIVVTAAPVECTKEEEAGSQMGNPIAPSSGSKKETAQDYADSSPHPLSLTRNYSSGGGMPVSGLGNGVTQYWSHSWAFSLVVQTTTAVVTLGDGSTAAFIRAAVDRPWMSDSNADGFDQTAIGFTYVRSGSDSKYYFDSNGRLLSIQERNGWTATLDYDTAGRLIQAKNAFGRTLGFTYSAAGQLMAVTSPDGQTIRYGFDGSQRLTTVQLPGLQTKTYHYEDSRWPNALTGITDESNVRFASYSYDANGFAATTSHSGGAGNYSISYINNPSLLTSKLVAGTSVDPAIYRSTAVVTDPLNNQQVWSYQGGDGRARVTGASGPFMGGTVASRSFNSGTTLPAEETDFLGVKTMYTWDVTRRLPLVTTKGSGLPEAQSVSTQWHPTFRLPERVTEPGKSTAYTYDAQGNKLSEKIIDAASAEERVWQWSYQPNGLIASMTDPKGGLWRYTYDAQGNRASAKNPLNHETLYTHDGAGRITQETALNGLISTYSYDLRGRLLASTTGNEATAYSYHPTGQLASVRLPSGLQVSYTYDAAQRLIAASDNRGNTIAYTLDAMGNRLREEVRDSTGALALVTAKTINSLNRVAALQGASGQTTAMAYDANGQPSSQTDPLNQTTQQSLDGLRRPVRTTFADNAVAQQSWSALDQLASVTDPKGVQTTYQRNAFGDVLLETSPDSGSIRYQRDALGDITGKVDAKGISNAITRDAIGRPLEVRYSATNIASYTWDAGTPGSQVGYLAKLEDASGTTAYQRDAFGRVLVKTQSVNDNPSAPTILTTAYSYDTAANKGLLASITYPSGLKVLYRRSASGQVLAIDTQKPFTNPKRPSAVTNFVTGLTYTALGQPKAWSWASGDSAARSFDMDARMSANEFASYSFDAASRITGITQSLWASKTVTQVIGTGTAVVSQLYQTPLSWTASYDSRNRLISFNRAGSDASYSYDANSNRLSAMDKTTSDTDLDGSFDADDFSQTSNQALNIESASNKLLGFTQSLSKVRGTKTLATTHSAVNYSLDQNGNLTTDGLRSFEYDPANRLSKVIVSQDGQAAAVSYLHNANGQRTFKSEPKADQYQPDEAELGTDFVTWLKKNFSWLFAQAQADASIGTAYTFADGELPSWALLGEYDNGSAAGKGRTEYIWLPTEDSSAIPLGLVRNGKFFAIHTDHLGTPRLMTNEQNAAVWQWPYSGFGNNKPTGVLKATPNPRAAMTNSPVLLRATGATEMNLRFPGQYADDETGQFYNYFRNYQPSQGRYTQGDPIGLEGGPNRFLYAEADSLNFTDPEGLNRRPGGAPVIPLFPRMGQTLPPANPQVGTTRAPIEVRPGTNLPGEVNGRTFSGHAFDRMQGRGLPPSAVVDALLSGRQSPGSRPNTTQHHDPVNNITVVTNSTTGNVITVRNGPPSKTCQ